MLCCTLGFDVLVSGAPPPRNVTGKYFILLVNRTPPVSAGDGAWCVVSGVWCVVCGAWCVVRGVHKAGHPATARLLH